MSKDVPTVSEIQKRVAEAAFGKPLVTNVNRGLVAEAIVAAALEPAWRWCSEDYSAWDFEHPDGARLEVKQSAARQSWATEKPSACLFDIAHRSGRWEGANWIGEPGRNAQIYVFAHHAIFDDSADHRDASQWRFYVVPTPLLPPTKRISLTTVVRLADGCRFSDLKDRIDSAKLSVAPS